MSRQILGRGEGEASPIPKCYGSSTNVEKKGEISKMFLRQNLDVRALSEPKLRGKGEVMFGEVVGRVSGVGGGRASEGVALLDM